MRGLAASFYTDPGHFAVERTRVLAPSWQLTCHVADLPGPGTAIRFDFLGRSALLLRGRDGAVRGFLNVCRHRGSRLIDGDAATGLAFCVDGKVRCPYHGWTYDDAGSLVAVPREEEYAELERSALGLRALRVETCSGFVFVAFEPPSGSVAGALGDFLDGLAPYRIASMRRVTEPRLTTFRANWKLLCEHGLDSVRPALAAARTTEQRGAALRIAGRIEAQTAPHWSARAYDRWLPAVTQLPVADQRRWSCLVLWPNLRLDFTPDMLWFSQCLPQGPAMTVVREVGYALPDASHPMRLARWLNERLRRRASLADRRIVERVQAGLETGDYEPGPMAGGDAGQAWFVERSRASVEDRGDRRT